MLWLLVGMEIAEIIGPSGDSPFVPLCLNCNIPCNSSHWLSIPREKERGRRKGTVDQDAWFSIPVPLVTVTVILNKSFPLLFHSFLHMFPIFSSVLSPFLSFYHPDWAQAYPEGISDLVVAGGLRREKSEWGDLVK